MPFSLEFGRPKRLLEIAQTIQDVSTEVAIGEGTFKTGLSVTFKHEGDSDSETVTRATESPLKFPRLLFPSTGRRRSRCQARQGINEISDCISQVACIDSVRIAGGPNFSIDPSGPDAYEIEATSHACAILLLGL